MSINKQTAFANTRAISLSATIGGTAVSNDYIVSAQVTENGSDGSLCMGGVFANQLTLVTYLPDGVLLHYMDEIVLTVTINGYSEDMGKYYVNSFSRNDNNGEYEVVAYSKVAYVNVEYVPTITSPATIHDIVDDIATNYGLDIESNAAESIVAIPSGVTVRQMLGYIAGRTGRNYYTDRSGALKPKWYSKSDFYDSAYEITDDDILMGGFSRTNESQVSITDLRCGELSTGNGNYIEIDCPFMTEQDLYGSQIGKLERNFTYQPCTIDYLGHPGWHVWNCIKYGDYLIPITTLTYNISGGMTGTIESAYETENEQGISSSAQSGNNVSSLVSADAYKTGQKSINISSEAVLMEYHDTDMESSYRAEYKASGLWLFDDYDSADSTGDITSVTPFGVNMTKNTTGGAQVNGTISMGDDGTLNIYTDAQIQKINLGSIPKINGTALVRYYTTGDWRVREWSDGTVEAWRTITPTLTFGTALGSYIHYQTGTTTYNLPTTYTEKPNITVTCTDGNLVFATVNALTTSTFKLNYTRLMSGTPSSAERNFCIYVIGKKA